MVRWMAASSSGMIASVALNSVRACATSSSVPRPALSFSVVMSRVSRWMAALFRAIANSSCAPRSSK
jgi:hypothetical protein